MRVRTYGNSGPLVIVLHGGPGAAGHMAPVARGLAESLRILEPFQRGSSAIPLTVARHIEDLRELVESCGEGTRPALVGSSWGAMLALAFAAGYPDLAGPLVLIGCGTFDTVARGRMQTILDERLGAPLRLETDDPDQRLRTMAQLLLPLYSCELSTTDLEVETCDTRAYQETWADMLRLQAEGIYPAAFSAIRSPILMLHGTVDPHPGRMILASLQQYVPQIEYREWERCGHYPWLERAVREEFFRVIKDWLAGR